MLSIWLKIIFPDKYMTDQIILKKWAAQRFFAILFKKKIRLTENQQKWTPSKVNQTQKNSIVLMIYVVF